MNLLQTIPKESVSIALESRVKSGVLEEMLDLAMRGGQVHDRKAALKCIREREKKMSTGMHHGVAIPHGKTDAVDRLVAAVGISREGVDFESIDGQPARIFILSISPANRAGPQIQFLAEISRILNQEERRTSFLKAATVEDLHHLLLETP